MAIWRGRCLNLAVPALDHSVDGNSSEVGSARIPRRFAGRVALSSVRSVAGIEWVGREAALGPNNPRATGDEKDRE